MARAETVTYYRFYEAAALYCLDKSDAADAAFEMAVAEVRAALKPVYRQLVAGSGHYMIGRVHLGTEDRDAAATSWRSARIKFATAMDLSDTMILRKDKVKRIIADCVERVKNAEGNAEAERPAGPGSFRQT